MKAKDIIAAWAKIRETNSDIPDDVLDLMKKSAIATLSNVDASKKMELFSVRIIEPGYSSMSKEEKAKEMLKAETRMNSEGPLRFHIMPSVNV